MGLRTVQLRNRSSRWLRGPSGIGDADLKLQADFRFLIRSTSSNAVSDAVDRLVLPRPEPGVVDGDSPR